MQVALFLVDEDCFGEASRQTANTVREGLRSQCWDCASSVMEALSCLPMVRLLASATDDPASAPLPTAVQELSTAADSPELSSILGGCRLKQW